MCTDRKDEVNSFLLTMKNALQRHNNSNWTFSTIRNKNMDTLADLGKQVQDVREVLLSLTPDDYCQGPFEDRGIEGQLWEFGKTVDSKEIYIKIKLSEDKRDRCVRVLSFHYPERPIYYPFKEKGKKESIS